MERRYLFLVPLLSATIVAGESPVLRAPNDGAVLQLQVSDFHNNDRPLIPTLLLIARTYAVPIGIEKTVPLALTKPVHIELREGTLGQLLSLGTASLPGFAWSLSDGVIDVYGNEERQQASNLFNSVLSQFELSNGTINDANAELREAVSGLSAPAVARTDGRAPSGIGGDSPGIGELEGERFSFVMRNATVRDILNRIARLSRGRAAWVARVPPTKLTTVPQGGLWQLLPLSGDEMNLPSPN